MMNTISRFYPTYEALKHLACISTRKGILCFYPTYEALKLLPYISHYTRNINVFTLPMRHWNQNYWSHRCKRWWVFTLPMRHWNVDGVVGNKTIEAIVFTLPMRHWNSLYIKFHGFDTLFLPYLWGIETLVSVIGRDWLYIVFLPYLWGIETNKERVCVYIKKKSFYPTYEALKQPFFKKKRWERIPVFTLPMRHWNS